MEYVLHKIEKDLYKKFKLTTNINTTNMTLFGSDNKLKTYKYILIYLYK